MPDPAAVRASHFAWRCPRGLTGSFDFRVSPTVPGQAYLHELVLKWQFQDDVGAVEADLLNLRDDWMSPMTLRASAGRALAFPAEGEQPRAAVDSQGCFDRSIGRSVLEVQDDRLEVRLDPGPVPRRRVGLAIRGLEGDREPRCDLNGRSPEPENDLLMQRPATGEMWLWLRSPIHDPVALKVEG